MQISADIDAGFTETCALLGFESVIGSEVGGACLAATAVLAGYSAAAGFVSFASDCLDDPSGEDCADKINGYVTLGQLGDGVPEGIKPLYDAFSGLLEDVLDWISKPNCP